MPKIAFRQLVERFTATLERAGATVLLSAEAVRKPAKLRVVMGESTFDCLVFLWTITPGGGGEGVRPAGERRIQITNSPPFPLQPGTRTIVGGFSPTDGVWAFWDARRHGRFSPRSPSLQVSANTLETASFYGLDTHQRSTRSGAEEIVVAVRPEALLWYVEHGEELHDVATDIDEVRELLTATESGERELIDAATSSEEVARRYQLVQTMRAFRDARFRPAVLQAYSFQCAVCGTALKLVDAAHIVPISEPDGNDDVTNGLALCRLHHAAYDTGLMGIQSSYRVVTNDNVVHRLRDAGLVAGLEAFRQGLPEVIHVPSESEVRPDRGRLRKGLIIRQFPASLIA